MPRGLSELVSDLVCGNRKGGASAPLLSSGSTLRALAPEATWRQGLKAHQEPAMRRRG
ncbi:hypothetical protein SBA2_860020 [Acidobacteriia bacterium SbA2]|nr:hypothetical protein SBA2_860020 [Acidobacteriia bacterium SbA2]